MNDRVSFEGPEESSISDSSGRLVEELPERKPLVTPENRELMLKRFREIQKEHHPEVTEAELLRMEDSLRPLRHGEDPLDFVARRNLDSKGGRNG